MQEDVKRGKEFTLVFVLENGRIVKVEKSKLFRKYGVHDTIRLPKKDFSYLKKVKTYLTHFNLQKSKHQKGKRYALVLIVKHGFFDGKRQVSPVLSFKDAVIAECIGVQEKVPYDKLTKEDFKYSFEHIKSVLELKKAIVRRYRKSMPHLSEEEILSLGVGITRLRILERI